MSYRVDMILFAATEHSLTQIREMLPHDSEETPYELLNILPYCDEPAIIQLDLGYKSEEAQLPARDWLFQRLAQGGVEEVILMMINRAFAFPEFAPPDVRASLAGLWGAFITVQDMVDEDDDPLVASLALEYLDKFEKAWAEATERYGTEPE